MATKARVISFICAQDWFETNCVLWDASKQEDHQLYVDRDPPQELARQEDKDWLLRIFPEVRGALRAS